jgi:putative peptide-modifying radical SAM enzyme
MTVDETCDIYKNVTHLYDNYDYSFSSIHWQIDAQFWKADYETRDFKAWSQTYNLGIKKLTKWWLDKIKQNKSVPKLYPFIAIIQTLLTKEKVPMRCGAGHSLLGIQTNGKVVACPITAGYKPLYMGDIKTSSLDDIKNNPILPDGPCLKCSIKDVCGGRCLYANKSMLWGELGFEEVCDTIFYLVNSLQEIVPDIDNMIKNKQLKLKDFNYEKYNGAEIIP